MRSATLMMIAALLCMWGHAARAQVEAEAGAEPAAAETAPVSTPDPSDVEPAPDTPEPESEPTEQPSPPQGEDAEATDDTAADASYNIKLRAIEERVNELKEKIFQSKARLIQLQEVVLHGTITGAKAVLIHRNEMGSSFKLFRVQYSLDGAPILNRVDSGQGELSEQEEIEIFNGSIAPGNHQISVYLEYKGHGFGVFSYLKGYKFKIKSSYTFTAEEGKLTTIRIIGYEKGGLTTQLKDRPSVQYKQEVARELRREDVEGTAPAPGAD